MQLVDYITCAWLYIHIHNNIGLPDWDAFRMQTTQPNRKPQFGQN